MSEDRIRFCLKQDSDGHWYCVPKHLEDDFGPMLEEAKDINNNTLFMQKYGPYKLDCHLSCYDFCYFRRVY